MRSISVRNLYDGLKLVEKSTAILLKKTRQINDSNKKLEPVESKKLFWCQKIFQQVITFYLYCYFIPSFTAMLRYYFPLILIYYKGLLQYYFRSHTGRFLMPSGRELDTLPYKDSEILSVCPYPRKEITPASSISVLIVVFDI